MTGLKAIPGGRQGRDGPPAQRFGHDLEAERAVLANCLLDPGAIDEVAALLESDVFASEAHRRTWEAVMAIRTRGEPVDIVSVMSELRATDRLQQVGAPYLTDMLETQAAMITAHLVARARMLRDLWVRRDLSVQAQALVVKIEHDSAHVAEILGEARAGIDALGERLSAAEDTKHVRVVLDRAFASMQAAAATNGRGELPTGFDRLDRLTAGLHPELLILAGRPGMAKTSMAMAIAGNIATSGAGVFVASLETQDQQLMQRQACAEARVDVQCARTGMLRPSDWQRMSTAMTRMAQWPMYVDDISAMTVVDLWSRCRNVQAKMRRAGSDLKLVVVDYVQLLKAPRGRMDREQVVAENVRGLKAMAQDLGACVIGVAQLNRKCEERGDKRPALSDLRESGELEQCARTVLLLYRDEYYKRDTQERGILEVDVAKQNNGPTGMVKLRFEAEYTRVDNLAEGEYDNGGEGRDWRDSP